MRDPYRKKELEKLVRGNSPARGGGGKRKLGVAGGTVAEAVSHWKYYE